PWWLEVLGVISPRAEVSGSDIVLHTVAPSLDTAATLAGIAVYIAGVTHLAALLSRLLDDDRRVVRRTMLLQSWQLRQLVPRTTMSPLSSKPAAIPRT